MKTLCLTAVLMLGTAAYAQDMTPPASPPTDQSTTTGESSQPMSTDTPTAPTDPNMATPSDSTMTPPATTTAPMAPSTTTPMAPNSSSMTMPGAAAAPMPATQNYPLCSRTVTDQCQNPGEGGAPGRSRAANHKRPHRR